MKRSNVIGILAAAAVIVLSVVLISWYLTKRTPMLIQGTVECTTYKASSKVPGRIDDMKVAEGDRVDVTGISKGHGYQGVIKRHGAHRLKETHGSGPVARQIGSLGATSHMSKIIKGTIGAGHKGVEQVTVQNLSGVKGDPELNMLVVCGAIPGPKGGLVTIKSTVKVHKVKQAGADISKNPQKASGRNPQKASARNK